MTRQKKHVAAYVPKRGDVVNLDLSPQSGKEQTKRRPALVLTPEKYNRTVGLCIVCPITSEAKGYPFKVAIPAGYKVTGVVLTDQARCSDWNTRNSAHLCATPQDVIEEVLDKLADLLEM